MNAKNNPPEGGKMLKPRLDLLASALDGAQAKQRQQIQKVVAASSEYKKLFPN